MLANLIAMVGNMGFRSFKKPVQASDFMPSHVGQPVEEVELDPREALREIRESMARAAKG